jgi:hypothetical protein
MAAPISYDEKLRLDKDVDLYNNTISAAQASTYKNQNKAAEIQADIAAIKADQASSNPQTTPQTLANAEKALATTQARIDSNLETIKQAETSKAEAQAQLATFGEQTSVPSATDVATEKKYEDPTRVPDSATNADSLRAKQDQLAGEGTDGSALTKWSDDKKASRLPSNIGPGAVNKNSAPASAAWAGAKDLRVFLRVPNSYLVGPSEDKIGYPLLKDLGGIMFPYTPQITYESAAAYTAVNPVHSNYTQQFYKNSSVGNISISGKFTVQNQKEGAIYCAIINLLRSLTKMRWGEYDANAGAPPPVCRLDAFGDYMLSNVPVVVTSVKFEMPDTVDYIQVPMYKTTLVPTISTITLGLAIMYSRRETQDFNVDDFMTGKLKGQGYL